MKELWRDIKGYEKLYQVSNKGRTRSLNRKVKHSRCGWVNRKGAIKAVNNWKKGYPTTTLWKNNNCGLYTIHRLVAHAFLKKPKGKEYVNHKDGNRLNNSVENLEWCTCSENNSHAIRTGLINTAVGTRLPQSKLKEKDILDIVNLYKKGNHSCSEIGNIYKVTSSCISSILRKDSWKHINREPIRTFRKGIK